MKHPAVTKVIRKKIYINKKIKIKNKTQALGSSSKLDSTEVKGET